MSQISSNGGGNQYPRKKAGKFSKKDPSYLTPTQFTNLLEAKQQALKELDTKVEQAIVAACSAFVIAHDQDRAAAQLWEESANWPQRVDTIRKRARENVCEALDGYTSTMATHQNTLPGAHLLPHIWFTSTK
jgi:hypothetical protein